MGDTTQTRTVEREKRAHIALSELEQIIRRDFRPGDRLPSEQDLAKRLAVSRNTMREALENLRINGILVRKWGLGTFVNPNAALIETSLSELAPLPEIIRGSGHQCRMTDLQYREYAGPISVHGYLSLEPDTKLWELERVYLADDEPVIYLRDYLPSTLNGAKVDLSAFKEDMLAFLHEQCSIILDHTVTHIEPVLPDDNVREKLTLPAGIPLLLTKQVAYSAEGLPLVYTEGFQRTDKLSFHIIRRRR